MNQISPFKSSAFRITLVYVLLFGLSVFIILGFIYWSTIVYTNNQTESEINAELEVLSQAYKSRGYPGLVTLLSDRVRIQRQRPGDSSVYLLVDEQFQTLVGNISSWPKVALDRDEGWLDFKLDGADGEFTARARTFVVENRYNLLVGQGMKDLANLKQLVGRALFWGLGLTLFLAVIGGFMMRQTLSSRLSTINQTASKIMRGDLRRRIDTKGSGDEFDELANNLNSMLDQIEGGMEGVRRVSDNIAHDLKTPLARLKNRAEELRLHVAGNIEQEKSVDQIVHEADGLLATFNALLRIARIEYSEQRKGFTDVDINSIIHDIEELYEPLSEERGQKLHLQLAQSVDIWADRDMLFQAFANLIDNAIKYTPKGGVVTIRSHFINGEWRLEIADNGPGIPENEYDMVVQRFYRLDQSRTTPGSGLGLALVFAVLKVHNMKLEFSDNKPGLKVVVSTQKSTHGLKKDEDSIEH